MKRRILLIVSIVGITFATALFFHSCELTDCATCKQIRTDTNGSETTLATVAACDEELDSYENEPPVTIGGVTTKWVCQ